MNLYKCLTDMKLNCSGSDEEALFIHKGMLFVKKESSEGGVKLGSVSGMTEVELSESDFGIHFILE